MENNTLVTTAPTKYI